MRRYNQRLFRVARAIVRDDAEAEDVVQQGYVSAFENADGFAGRSQMSTWLTRIVINEAVRRKRRNQREDRTSQSDASVAWLPHRERSPEDAAALKELTATLEKLIDRLPESQRLVLILRDVEGLSVAETANSLDLSDANTRVLLHRARQALREKLEHETGMAKREVFSFAGERCDRIVAGVLRRLAPGG